MIAKLAEDSYGIKVSSVELLDRHFGTEIYRVTAREGWFILKTLPSYAGDCETEGKITEHLSKKGLRVARLCKNRWGTYTTEVSGVRFTLQKLIEGITLSVNSAPEWFMERSADYLGRTVSALKGFPGLPVRFGADFFDPARPREKWNDWISELEKAKRKGDAVSVPYWEEQICWLEKISEFKIDTGKLTYAASHGDFHIGQAIVKDEDITVVDWSSACRLPVCLDVVTSFVFASPACAGGEIDPEGLKKYIRRFTGHYPLNDYDIKAMPYVLFFWHTMCNYRPDEYGSLPESYRPTAELLRRLLAWLFVHVDGLSESLCSG